MGEEEIAAAREALRARLGDGARREGVGKGMSRRKKPAAHRPVALDDRKLQTSLKRLGVSSIPGIEEVTMITNEDKFLHFTTPRVQAAPNANTYVVSGHADTKDISQLPKKAEDQNAMIQSLLQAAAQHGPDGLSEKLQSLISQKGGAAADAAGDDDVPTLEENFDEAAGLD